MKPVRHYLDEAESAGLVKNDSDIARQLGVSRQTICEWRAGRSSPNEDQAAALAALLGKPEIMAECMAARAKNPVNRAMWEKAAKTLSMAAALVVTIGVNLLLAPSPANAAPALKTQHLDLYYVNY